jgi:hypothetical protein
MQAKPPQNDHQISMANHHQTTVPKIQAPNHIPDCAKLQHNLPYTAAIMVRSQYSLSCSPNDGKTHEESQFFQGIDMTQFCSCITISLTLLQMKCIYHHSKQ